MFSLTRLITSCAPSDTNLGKRRSTCGMMFSVSEFCVTSGNVPCIFSGKSLPVCSLQMEGFLQETRNIAPPVPTDPPGVWVVSQ